MKELNVELENEDIASFKSCETEGKEGLTFNGFVRFVQMRLERIFQEIDLDGSGFIDSHEVIIMIYFLKMHTYQSSKYLPF